MLCASVIWQAGATTTNIKSQHHAFLKGAGGSGKPHMSPEELFGVVGALLGAVGVLGCLQ